MLQILLCTYVTRSGLLRKLKPPGHVSTNKIASGFLLLLFIVHAMTPAGTHTRAIIGCLQVSVLLKSIFMDPQTLPQWHPSSAWPWMLRLQFGVALASGPAIGSEALFRLSQGSHMRCLLAALCKRSQQKGLEQVLLAFILRSAMEPISCLGMYMRPTLPFRVSAPTFFSCKQPHSLALRAQGVGNQGFGAQSTCSSLKASGSVP